ncbi:MAG: protein phosphatase 2C domain-containing protein, partial [Chloroflexota bacterium]
MNSDRFVMRAGSVCGRAHRGLDQANQDAVYCHGWAGGLVAVICDGCGSAPHSGLGAALGCRLTAGALIRRQDMLAEAASIEDAEHYLAAVQADVLTALAALVVGCPDPAERTIHDCLLFTIIGIVISGENAVLFALGDGVIGYNGDIQVLGPYPNNAPPYLGYALLPDGTPATVPAAAGDAPRDCGNTGDRLRGPEIGARVSRPAAAPAAATRDWTAHDRTKRAWRPAPLPRALDHNGEALAAEGAEDAPSYSLACHAFLPAAELHTAVIGSDGVVDALRGAARPLPGTAEPFGPLSQFWEDDRYARNPDLLRRRLARAARAVPGTPAILSDDTS